jgi:hypothetical protein
MSYENQELTEHEETHTKWLDECEFCQSEKEQSILRNMLKN